MQWQQYQQGCWHIQDKKKKASPATLVILLKYQKNSSNMQYEKYKTQFAKAHNSI
jgi:hypothetical protein